MHRPVAELSVFEQDVRVRTHSRAGTARNPPKASWHPGCSRSPRGIPTEAAGKLFTPFYSTKKDGQGVGLMLSREILSQHGFAFSLNNVVDGGAITPGGADGC